MGRWAFTCMFVSRRPPARRFVEHVKTIHNDADGHKHNLTVRNTSGYPQNCNDIKKYEHDLKSGRRNLYHLHHRRTQRGFTESQLIQACIPHTTPAWITLCGAIEEGKRPKRSCVSTLVGVCALRCSGCVFLCVPTLFWERVGEGGWEGVNDGGTGDLSTNMWCFQNFENGVTQIFFKASPT